MTYLLTGKWEGIKDNTEKKKSKKYTTKPRKTELDLNKLIIQIYKHQPRKVHLHQLNDPDGSREQGG